MRKFRLLLQLFIVAALSSSCLLGQVNISASAGVTSGTYTNLNGAFSAINGGVHQGIILVSISSDISEPGPAVLNSSGAGPASYQSVRIFPTNDSVVISGLSTKGHGLIELNGADSIIIDGDNPLTGGVNRNLTIKNIDDDTTKYNSTIRVATSDSVTTANEISILNCNIIGSAVDRNKPSANLNSGSENSTFGIYVGGNGGVTSTSVPDQITSDYAIICPANTTVNNFLAGNCFINSCARGVSFLGRDSTSSNKVIIIDNAIGDQSVTTMTVPPINSPMNTVYSMGIVIRGANALTINNNTLRNIMSYIKTSGISAIEAYSGIGSGLVEITGNNIDGICRNATFAGYVAGIELKSGIGQYSIRNNTINNVVCRQVNTAVGIESSSPSLQGSIESNIITHVYNYHPSTYAAWGISISGGGGTIVKNNFVADLNHDMSFGAATDYLYAVVGINISSGTGHQVYNNTVNLFGSMIGSPQINNVSTCLWIKNTLNADLDVRNNLFSNTMTGGPSANAHVSIHLPSAATSSMNLILNNNVYYCGSDSLRQGIALVGITPTNIYLPQHFNALSTGSPNNLRTYTSNLNPSGLNDSVSLVSNQPAPLVSNLDLHIDTLNMASLLLNGAATPLTGVTTDIDNDLRDLVLPDIGADEFNADICDSINAGSAVSSLDTVCSGQQITLTSTGMSSIPGTAYQWMVSSIPGGPYTNVTGGTGDTTSVYLSDPLTAGVYYYIFQALCQGGPSEDLSNEVSVIVNSIPSIGFTVNPNDTVCMGDSVTLMGSGADIYSWSGGVLDGIGFIQGSPMSYFTLTGIDTNGCYDTVGVTIIANPLPDIDYSVSPNDSVCFGDSLILNGIGGVSYSWSAGVTNNVPFLPISTQTYIVSGTDNNGCTNLDSVSVEVNPLPIPNLGPDIITTNPPVVLDAGPGYINYLWNTLEMTQTISVDSNGIFIAEVTDLNGCMGSDTISVVFTASIESQIEESGFIKYYPNPVDHVLNIEASQLLDRIMIYDGRGQIVKTIINYFGSSTISIDVSELNPGVYWILAIENSTPQNWGIKFIKQ